MLLSNIDEENSKKFKVKLKYEIHEDSYTSRSYFHVAQTLIKKVLHGISCEEVCKLEFNCIDEAKTFYMFAKVANFSIQKADLKWDKNEDIISQK